MIAERKCVYSLAVIVRNENFEKIPTFMRKTSEVINEFPKKVDIFYRQVDYYPLRNAYGLDVYIIFPLNWFVLKIVSTFCKKNNLDGENLSEVNEMVKKWFSKIEPCNEWEITMESLEKNIRNYNSSSQQEKILKEISLETMKESMEYFIKKLQLLDLEEKGFENLYEIR